MLNAWEGLQYQYRWCSNLEAYQTEAWNISNEHKNFQGYQNDLIVIRFTRYLIQTFKIDYVWSFNVRQRKMPIYRDTLKN